MSIYYATLIFIIALPVIAGYIIIKKLRTDSGITLGDLNKKQMYILTIGLGCLVAGLEIANSTGEGKSPSSLLITLIFLAILITMLLVNKKQNSKEKEMEVSYE